ncbi:DUF3575 domain-containing protein [Chryseobacterium sp. MP_3.2]|uniref:DUF3575 domain-containing protein n=1 Tax=Chryseobacterium sp. MP_3.2 TaxID=3071712 RepID=UPI002E043B1A|nr:hypothetical protein [Chryseobacterium sp. MP_3.2]
MKKTVFLFVLFLFGFSSAQLSDSTETKKLYVKVNALFLPLGMLNAGLEYQVSKKMTIQGDIFISPWKSFAGKKAQVYMVGIEARYYFKEAFKHFYVGGNISAARYIIQKYSYWGSGTYQYKPDAPIYNRADIYQDGYSVIFGATAGYQFQLSEKWNMDFFLTAGSVQSIYKGYVKNKDLRYDTDTAPNFNRSGEFLPYRGGVMISYKLR